MRLYTLYMITLMTTRYNNLTWTERERWLEINGWTGAIYCTPIRVQPGKGETLIVLEMHNDENKIKAISILHNRAFEFDNKYDKLHRVYTDRNVNRYIYKSKYRLVFDKITLTPREKIVIAILDQLLFKGAGHSKRAHGITAVPKWIMQNRCMDFLVEFKGLLKRYFKKSYDSS